MYKGQTLSLKRLENNFVELCFDNQNESVNKFDTETVAEMTQALDSLAATENIRGLLVSSAKPIFVVGADIGEFTELFTLNEADVLSYTGVGKKNFNRLEDLPFPTVAAINGVAVGGGLEICLACDYRIASGAALVGLPETGLGILPGWGGTVRLSRLIDFEQAVQWVTTGANQKPMAALEAGVVNSVVAAGVLRESALEALGQLANGELDYSATRQQKNQPVDRPLAEVQTIGEAAKSAIQSKMGNHYPAPLKVVDVMVAAAGESRDAAMAIEDKGFYELTQTPQARALVGNFLADQYISKKSKAHVKAMKASGDSLESCGVIGAGIMGGGIAYQNVVSGYSVVMKDIAQPALDAGMKEANTLLAKQVKRGKMSEEKAAIIAAKIKPTLDNQDLANCDTIVEAVVELANVKKAVLGELEDVVTDKAILCSNTSTISITHLAENLKRPENFCGMHFFNPVHAMPLVEVIRGEKTSEATISKAVAHAIGMRKKPIVVNDCPGFLVNRVLFGYLFGFDMMVAEGVDFIQIDQVMEQWGWPMGPAYLIDVVGIDTCAHCYDVMQNDLPERFQSIGSAAPTKMVCDEGRFGQKNGRGYYKFEANEKGRMEKQLDSDVVELFANHFGEAKQIDAEEIVERTMVAMAIEMAHCLDEGIVETPAEADMALMLGLNFPQFRGGICRWMDEIGMDKLCQLGDKYKHISPLYEPTQSMRAMAEKGSTWY